MYGPVFKLGDKVVWEDEQDARTSVSRFEQGPFIVVGKKDNDDPQACACGASKQNNYMHAITGVCGVSPFYDSSYDDCAELPAQMVTLRQVNGPLVLDDKGILETFCSSWFKLLS